MKRQIQSILIAVWLLSVLFSAVCLPVSAEGTESVETTIAPDDASLTKFSFKTMPALVPVTKISITNAPKILVKGTTFSLDTEVLPDNASYKSFTWTTSAPNIAKVDQTGAITTVGSGTVTITATAKDGSGKYASCSITVHSYVTLKIGSVKAIQNGVRTTVDKEGTKPFKISGTTMLPLRFVGEKMGGKVTYISDRQPITMTYGTKRIEFTLGSKKISVIEGNIRKDITVNVAAQKVKGKTYIPLRAISEALGFDVYYESGTEYIVVNNPKMTTAIRNERLKEYKDMEAAAFEEFVELTIKYAERQPQYPVSKSGTTKYGALFGHPRAAWCTEFVMWCLKQAEHELGTSYIKTSYPWSSYSGGCVSWFQSRSRLRSRSSGYTPQRGDMIFFNYGTGGSTDHTGLVLGTEIANGKTYVLTIEGNIPTDRVKQIRKRRLLLTDRNIVSYGVCRK